MRYIDQNMKDKLKQAQQTLYNNANPQMELIVSRPKTTIERKQYWEESIISEDTTAICTSTAIRRQGKTGDLIYTAYVDSSNNLVVKVAHFRFPIKTLPWATVLNISNCIACALEFDGSYIQAGEIIEYRTDSLPWLFYVTQTGQLMGGILGGTYETLVGANVTSVDAIRGITSRYKEIDQGLIVFYTVDGYVRYKQFIDGVWGDQQAIDITPANAIKVKAERVWDWRIVLQVQTSEGKLYEVFSRQYYSGWVCVDQIKASASFNSIVVQDVVYTSFNQSDSEAIVAKMGDIDVIACSIYSPTMHSAYNYSILEYNEETEEWVENWGKWVLLKWSAPALNEQENLNQITMTDEYDYVYRPIRIIVDENFPNRWHMEFSDFNNALGEVTIVYTPGTLNSGVVSVEATSVKFTPQNLVPTYIPPPEVVSIYNADNQTILIEFDRDIIAIESQSGFNITGFEPRFSPEGDLIETTYVIDTIDYAEGTKLEEVVDFNDGSLTDMEVS